MSKESTLWLLPGELPDLPGARCAESVDPSLWDDHVTGETEMQRAGRHTQAVAICMECPVIQRCDQARAELDGRGVWGGLTPEQRSTRYRRWRQQRANDLAPESHCRWCGTQLRGGQLRFCSPPHDAAWRRHNSRDRGRSSRSREQQRADQRARVELLQQLTACGWSDDEMAQRLEVSRPAVQKLRKRNGIRLPNGDPLRW